MTNPRSQGGTWSQFDEDVLLARLIAQMPNGFPRTFVEIGCGDGSENNTRLLHEQGWWGEWYDASESNIARAREVKPHGTWCWRVTCEDFPLYRAQDFGVLSIDVDGMDYYLWKHGVQVGGWRPWIVVIEAQFQPGSVGRDPWRDEWMQPYDSTWVWPDDPATETYDWGATPAALIALGKDLGYEYVCKPENPHSPNLFFTRSDINVRVDTLRS